MGDQARVQGHDRDLHANLDALAEHAQGVGHQLHRAHAAMLPADAPLRAAEHMGCGKHPDARALKFLPGRVRDFCFARFLEAVGIGHAHDPRALRADEQPGGVSAAAGHDDMPDVPFRRRLQGQHHALLGIARAFFVKIHGSSLLIETTRQA